MIGLEKKDTELSRDRVIVGNVDMYLKQTIHSAVSARVSPSVAARVKPFCQRITYIMAQTIEHPVEYTRVSMI